MFAIEIRNVSGEVILNKHLEKEKYTIGRAPENDIWLPDPGLDLYHAELQVRQKALYVIDLNSENGTLKNGHIVEAGKEGEVLEDNDKILVGQHIIFVTESTESQILEAILDAEDEDEEKDEKGKTMAIGMGALDSDLFSGIVAIKKLNPRLVYVVDNKANRYEINKRSITMGRDESNEIPIDHPSISKIHAELYLRDGQFYIKDKNSMNGTFVNEVRVPEAQLPNHSYIRMGGVQALLITNYSIEEAVGYSDSLSNEEILTKLRQMKKLSPSQAAAIKDDIEMLHYTVSESAILKGYLSPADWMSIIRELKQRKSPSSARKSSVWIIVLLNLIFVLVLALVLLLYFKKS